jgi:cytochrome c
MSFKYPLAAVVSTLSMITAPANAQNSPDGERLYQQRCGSCHSIEPGQNRLGPHLSGVVGRTAGTVEGARYSPDMQKSGIVWDDKTLDTYLDNPRAIVPRTTMTIALRDAAQRSAIIDYLRKLSPRS